MLVSLLRDLRFNGIPATQTLVVDNGAAYDWEAIGGAQWTRWDGQGDRNISAWWNLGIDFAAGRPLLVLNDDVHLPEGTVPRLVKAINAEGSSIAHPDLSGQLTDGQWITERGLPPLKRNLFYRMTGWCFLLRGAPDDLRADENLRWWYGDDDLEWRARLEGGVTRVGETGAQHIDADGWVREYGDELMPLTHVDRERFVEKWGREPW